MEISALIMGLNEADQLPRLFAPLKVLKDIVYIDHQSTDNSVEVAKSLGARVFVREFIHTTAAKEDCLEFKKRFGYEPEFKAGDIIRHAGNERAQMQKHTLNNWVLNLDCDEVISWNYKKVQKMLPFFDVINCKFYHDRTASGERTDWFQTTKLYNKQKTFWIGRIHEVVNGYDLKVGFSEDMEIDHYHRQREYTKNYINHLEYAVLRDQDIRSFYYMGKEYYHWGFWEKSIKFFTFYLRESYYLPERVKSYIYIAACMLELGREDEAWVYCTQALKLNPNSQAAFLFLNRLSPKKHQGIWLKHAELAENDHLL